jgi:curved DNA-binding protein
MKYKDYYAALGVKRDASADEIKKAYRKLAQKHHPDVSKEKGSEERFKEIGEAYQTLKDPEKRAAYDQLGSSYRPGQEFRPPPDWEQRFSRGGGGAPGGGASGFSFDDIDLGDLFEHFGARGGAGGARARSNRPMHGPDFEAHAELSLEDAFRGAEFEFNGTRIRVPKGATDGQRLRIRGQGGPGANGGPNGDLYLNIAMRKHPVYRPDGHDLYMDLPLAPWEAALGAEVEVPTLAGVVSLKVPAGTAAGRKLRLGKRGLPKPGGGEGDLYAIAQIVNPPELSEREQELFRELRDQSTFNPRERLAGGG